MRLSLPIFAKSLSQTMSAVKAAVKPNPVPILYGYASSSCSWRVRAAFAHKELPFICQYYHPYEANSSARQDYEQVNPVGQVPSLTIDGINLTQSVAILEYLEETRPDPPLLPRDAVKRAQVRQIVELINSGIQPFQNPIVARRATDDSGKQKEWQVYWIEKGLTALEKILTTTEGKCCVGDQVTMADLCFVPQLFAARRFGADLTKFPVCTKLFDSLLELEIFRRTHPNNQPDIPAATTAPL